MLIKQDLKDSSGKDLEALDHRIVRLKDRLLTAPYEICMARAHYFTQSYKETKKMDPNLRNALALKKTLENQKINIYPDEFIIGNATEKYLSGPLSVDRGDFLRTLQLEIEILEKKIQPFKISKQDKNLFWKEILPYWDGRTVRDHKIREWKKLGIVKYNLNLAQEIIDTFKTAIGIKYIGFNGLLKMAGASLKSFPTIRQITNLLKLRFELAYNNPTPAIFCFDVQGHLSLGVDKVVENGMEYIINQAKSRLNQLETEEPNNNEGKNFLNAVIISLEAAIHFSERHASLAKQMAENEDNINEKNRLLKLAEICENVPRNKPRTFHEAIQTAWLTLCVGEIQYGTHEVFAVGRSDQYLYPYYKKDIESGIITKEEATALIQEFYLKITASVEPIPELGMETNGVLGNSQRCIAIGGLTPDGKDGTNELSYLMLDAHEQMKGAINQLSVRFHRNSPWEFIHRTAAVFRKANGIAMYNDEPIIKALQADGLNLEDARDYCVVGCIETSGQSDTHGCPGGHELVLPAILIMTLTRGRLPIPGPGQLNGFDSGDPATFKTFEDFLSALKKQLTYQMMILVKATHGKDKAYHKYLPAPYVSALMDDCIENAKDMTAGGARYDFTSIDVRGLATFVDSLISIKHLIYETKEISLKKMTKLCLKNFKRHEILRQRIINKLPKYGTGNEEADKIALNVLQWLYDASRRYRNHRGGKYRMCYYSYGNHVIDGLMLGTATPDGRLRGQPTSNGVSPSNIFEPKGGPTGPMNSVSKFPPYQISSGVSLNMRFHPTLLQTEHGLDSYANLIKIYFENGGMHLQPNVVSNEVLRDAQMHPEKHRDLVVKVSGYSAYFTDLGRSIQEDIIARCEFGK